MTARKQFESGGGAIPPASSAVSVLSGRGLRAAVGIMSTNRRTLDGREIDLIIRKTLKC
jgi:hypothetical protein